jgi:hypothetical protein
MPRHARIRLTMAHKIIAASVAAAGAATLAMTVVPNASHSHLNGAPAAAVNVEPVAFTSYTHEHAYDQWDNVNRQYWSAHHRWWLEHEAEVKAKAEAARKAAAAEAAAEKAAAEKAAAAKAAAQKAAAAKAAAEKAAAQKAAAAKAAAAKAAAATPAKPAATTASTTAATTASSTVYTNNLDGWIKHALAIMAANHIPGTYNGIYRNVMRESSGNPNAINLWDSNAAAGHPSKGLLQTIDSTFNAYHVAGTSTNPYDPVANIVAACNYAYHVYGSIDNVNGPY